MPELFTLPVQADRYTSWKAHINRYEPSTEPGVDLFCEIGTPVRAPADGWIYGSGNSIGPMTGRWVGIDHDNGCATRTLHHSKLLRTDGRVHEGDIVALSGASGYGEEDWSWNVADTGGAHTHWTVWENKNQKYFGYRSLNGGRLPWTSDPMLFVKKSAGSNQMFRMPEEGEMINFRNPVTGITYTLVPGIQLMAHVNGFGDRLTNYINTGVWPENEELDKRYAAGLRDLNKDHVNWMLPYYGFQRFNADTLPRSGVVYSDVIHNLMTGAGLYAGAQYEGKPRETLLGSIQRLIKKTGA